MKEITNNLNRKSINLTKNEFKKCWFVSNAYSFSQMYVFWKKNGNSFDVEMRRGLSSRKTEPKVFFSINN
jgi:hypothetical protein